MKRFLSPLVALTAGSAVVLGIPSRTERFRQALERAWTKDHSAT